MIELNELAGISLAEIVNKAELLTRVDRKYLLDSQVASDILAHVDQRSRVLEINGKRSFAYDSVYFDTRDHRSYLLSARKRRRRFKLRTRTYLDTGRAFLELKTKSGRGSTVKNRIAYAPDARETLDADGRAYLRGLLPQYGLEPSLTETVQPSLVSRYRRTTLLIADGSRITVDSDLAWLDPAEQAAPVNAHGQVIIETKSVGRAGSVDRLLWRDGRRPISISKFGVGTALIRPELPHNTWCRAIYTLNTTPEPTREQELS